MACGITKTVLGVTLACNNAGTTTHAGLHSASATILGRTVTWRWFAPATGQTAANTDNVPAFHKVQIVDQADDA